jgi:hypothetical protein
VVWSVLKGNNLSLECPRYGLNVPGFERRWEQDFPYPVRPAHRPTHPPVEWVPAVVFCPADVFITVQFWCSILLIKWYGPSV